MVYAFVSFKITNPDSLARYREVAASALAKHGGEVAIAGRETQVIEGNVDKPDLAAVLTFPDRDAALAWINDPEIQHVHEMRRGAGEVSIVLVGQA